MKKVLILTQPQDAHTPPVVEAIQQRGGSTFRLHTADFPESSMLTSTILQDGLSSVILYQDQSIPLENLTSIWRRRPEIYRVSGNYTAGQKAFIEEEADRALIGVLESLTIHWQTFWVSHTHSARKADLKALQLSVAQSVGLRVPQTLITNDPASVRSFYERCQGNIIVKPVSRNKITSENEGGERYIYTNKVAGHHLENLEGIRVTAHLFQEYIPKRIELRVVVIGRQVFAVEIHSQHSEKARIDFRQGYSDLRYQVHSLPEDVSAKIVKMVCYFGLQFSSMDILLTPEGEYVFLDLNPNGQYYWLELALPEMHMAEAMANVLVAPEEYCL